MLNSMNVSPTFTRLLVIGANPTQGFPITFKAVVTSARGVPSGRIQFKTESETLHTQPLEKGEAVFSTSALKKGKHTLIVEYEGSDRYSRSSARTVLQVQ
jgi:hypothetical protein